MRKHFIHSAFLLRNFVFYKGIGGLGGSMGDNSHLSHSPTSLQDCYENHHHDAGCPGVGQNLFHYSGGIHTGKTGQPGIKAEAGRKFRFVRMVAMPVPMLYSPSLSAAHTLLIFQKKSLL